MPPPSEGTFQKTSYVCSGCSVIRQDVGQPLVVNQEALAKAQRFEEFNRRFAFILHDIKNLVSQLSLVTRNAERHADNPEFRADMVATLQSSVGKMNDLLARLNSESGTASDKVGSVALKDVLGFAVAAKSRGHQIQLLGDIDRWVHADAHGLEQAVGHLLQNAVDASEDQPVQPAAVAASVNTVWRRKVRSWCLSG